MENRQDKWSGEMIISPEKIWHNVKKYWWIALIILGPILAFIAYTGMRNYRFDVASAQFDGYQSISTVYINSKDEDYTDSYKWILYSDDLRADMNTLLVENGFEEFDKNQDIVVITRMGDSMYYELMVRSVGYERTEFVAKAYTELLIDYAKKVMGLKGRVIDYPSLKTYVKFHDGSYTTFEIGEPKTVGLSLGAFVTWSKLMLLCAGAFLWVAIIMVFVFMDKILRTKRETDIATGMECICTIDKKNANALDLLAVMLDFTGKNSGKNHFVLATAEKNEKLSGIADEILTKLTKTTAGASVQSVTDIINNAMALEACGNADYVLLTVTLNQDKVPEVEQAVRNLQTIGAKVLGYVLIK